MDHRAARHGLDLRASFVKFGFNESSGEGRLETDIRYYRRRACEEMSAASRAVTSAARDRRLYLVNVYLERLKALNAPSPFDERHMATMESEPA
jgi:hypothetical protein